MMSITWILQGLLAVAFLVAGGMKLLKTREELLSQGAKMAWVEDFGSGSLRAIGALEVLGTLGLVIPTLTGILPVLTPIAAGGLVLIMVGATAVHIRRAEYGAVVPTLVLAVIAIAVIMLRV